MKIDSFCAIGGYTKLVLFDFLSPTVGSNNVAEKIVVSGVRLAKLRKCGSHGGLYSVYIVSRQCSSRLNQT